MLGCSDWLTRADTAIPLVNRVHCLRWERGRFISCAGIFKAAQAPLAEDVQRSDMIGPFVRGNLIRAELKRLGGHIECYQLTVVSKGSSKICFSLTYAKSNAAVLSSRTLGRMS